MAQEEFGVVMEGVLCTECGLAFAVPREYFDARVADRRPFSCMNGHSIALGVPAGAEKLVQSLEEKLRLKQVELDAMTTAAFKLDDRARTAEAEIVNLLVGSATGRREA